MTWKVGVAVDVECDTENDVGVVYDRENSHKPGCFAEDESLDGEFNIDVQTVLKGQELDSVVLGRGEDCFVVGDDSC